MPHTLTFICIRVLLRGGLMTRHLRSFYLRRRENKCCCCFWSPLYLLKKKSVKVCTYHVCWTDNGTDVRYAFVCIKPKAEKNSSWHWQMRNIKCVEWLMQDGHQPTQWQTTHNVTHMHIIGFMKCHIQRGTSQITHNAHIHQGFSFFSDEHRQCSAVQNVPELICTIFACLWKRWVTFNCSRHVTTVT